MLTAPGGQASDAALMLHTDDGAHPHPHPATVPVAAEPAARSDAWAGAHPVEATGTPTLAPRVLPGARGLSCRLWLRRGPQVKFGPKPPRVRALARDNSNPSLWPRPSDIYIVSYPKSGQTWIRFLLANLIRYEEAAACPAPPCLPARFLRQ